MCLVIEWSLHDYDFNCMHANCTIACFVMPIVRWLLCSSKGLGFNGPKTSDSETEMDIKNIRSLRKVMAWYFGSLIFYMKGTYPAEVF